MSMVRIGFRFQETLMPNSNIVPGISNPSKDIVVFRQADRPTIVERTRPAFWYNTSNSGTYFWDTELSDWVPISASNVVTTTTTTLAPIKSNLYVTSHGDMLISDYDRNTTDYIAPNLVQISKGSLVFNSSYYTSLATWGICISNDGKSVYVTTEAAQVISFFNRDILTGVLTRNTNGGGAIGAGTIARDIIISNDDKNVYSLDLSQGTVRAYDRNVITGVLTYNSVNSLPAGINPSGICISYDGKNVYVTDPSSGSDKIRIYDRNVSTGTLTANGTIPTQLFPYGIAISSDGTSVYAANYNSNTVSIYTRNVSTGGLTSNGTIAAGTNPVRIAISNNGKNVYVINQNSTGLSIYDRNISTGALTANGGVFVGTGSQAVRISADDENVYVGRVAGISTSQILVFNRSIFGNLVLISDYFNPFDRATNLIDMCIYPTPITSTAITTTTTTTTVSPTTTTTTTSIPAVQTDATVYVVNEGSDSISVFNRSLSSGALNLLSRVSCGSSLFSICISPDGRNAYVASRYTKGSNKPLITFERDVFTGGLIEIDSISNANGLDICISSNGKNVYLLVNGGIGIYDRNITTGILTFNSFILGPPTSQSICISPDGKSVYAFGAGYNYNIYVYSRDTLTGALSTYTYFNKNTANKISISPDGLNLYASSHGFISTYTRNPITGMIQGSDFINGIERGPPTIYLQGTSGPDSLVSYKHCVSKDGKNVYVTVGHSNQVFILSRNLSNGYLTKASVIETESLPSEIAMSFDDNNVYVTNYKGTSVSVFSRNLLTIGL